MKHTNRLVPTMAVSVGVMAAIFLLITPGAQASTTLRRHHSHAVVAHRSKADIQRLIGGISRDVAEAYQLAVEKGPVITETPQQLQIHQHLISQHLNAADKMLSQLQVAMMARRLNQKQPVPQTLEGFKESDGILMVNLADVSPQEQKISDLQEQIHQTVQHSDKHSLTPQELKTMVLSTQSLKKTMGY